MVRGCALPANQLSSRSDSGAPSLSGEPVIILERRGRGGSVVIKETPITNEDIRRIRISCRCGTDSLAEVPEQFAREYLPLPELQSALQDSEAG